MFSLLSQLNSHCLFFRLADVLLGWAQQHQDEQRKQTEENNQKEKVEQRKRDRRERRKKVGQV